MARRKLAPKPKTGYGNGSVHEEKKGSGRWIAELGGTRRRAKSEEEANEKLLYLQELRDKGVDLGKSSQSLQQWLDIWIRVCLPSREKPPKARTIQGYIEIIRLYISPYPIAKLAVEKITVADIRKWLAELKSKGLSGNTRANAFRRLRTALTDAKREGLLAANPADEVDEPDTTDKRVPVVLDVEEFGQFFAVWLKHRLFALFAVAATLGLRVSELYGLRWRDIDFEQGVLSINGQLHRLKIEPDRPRRPVWVDSTKTPSGQRKIAAPPELIEVLLVWKEQQRLEQLAMGSKWQAQDQDYVFTTSVGTPLNKDNVRRAFKQGLKRAGLPDMTQHDFRHSVASLMLAKGEDIESVKEVIGHSSRTVLERIYAHALPTSKVKAGHSLGFLLSPEQEEEK